MSGSIRLHKTLGLNPKLGICPICRDKENGEILLPGAAVKEEYPRHMIGRGLCDSCKALLGKDNVAFINKNNGDSSIIKGKAVKRMFKDKYAGWKGQIVVTEHTFWAEK